MSKLLSVKIDVKKLDKSRFFQGKNGAVYCDLDVWLNDEADEWGNHGSVNQSQTKQERQNKEKKTFVGNARKIWGWDDAPIKSDAPETKAEDEDIPF